MDPVKNPFAPGAGSPPPELAGRAELLEQARIAIARMREGRSAKSLILVGLRGVGKTVLLVRMKEIAETSGYKAFTVEAHEGKPLAGLLVPPLRQILFALDAVSSIKEKSKRALRVLKSFMNAVRIQVGDVDVNLSIDPERGTADSGDLEADLGALLIAIGDAARSAKTAVGICIDELQYLSEREFSALIMAIHKTNQEQLPIAMIGAGLPQIRALAGRSKSYSERLFDFPEVGALPAAAAREAIALPAGNMDVQFSAAALEEILRQTERYPYFLQQWAYEAWNIADASPIALATIEKATTAAIKSLDQGFFRVRFDRCTPSERRYLRALAELGPGSQRSGEIAEKLNVKSTSLGPTRSKLIAKGMIYAPQHAETAFTVPMFDEYMLRVMPGESWRTA